jgi:hypothetical protein
MKPRDEVAKKHQQAIETMLRDGQTTNGCSFACTIANTSDLQHITIGGVGSHRMAMFVLGVVRSYMDTFLRMGKEVTEHNWLDLTPELSGPAAPEGDAKP